MAENVHEWPEGYATLVKHGECGLFYKPGERPNGYHLNQYFREIEWQAARDDLSGKPNWDDVVGEWIAQDEDGHWYSFDSQPHHSDRCWHNSPCHREGPGKVLGDWRNTLEKRPNKKKTYTVDEVIDELDIRREVNEASVALGFRQWRGMEDGLPPVGDDIEVWYDDGRECWKRAVVIGYHPESKRTIAVNVNTEGHNWKLMWSTHFLPIPTEEDKAVEQMLALDCDALSRADFCRALYRAGLRFTEQESE